MCPKKVVIGVDARKGILDGIIEAGKVIGSTLGPGGSTVIIGRSYGDPIVTKDGVTVAKELDMVGDIKKVGVDLIKATANRANDEAGDGTTTTSVLMAEMCKNAVRLVTSGTNATALNRGIDKAVDAVIKILDKIKVEIKSNEQLRQVAVISGNGDQEIGDVIAKAFGDDPKSWSRKVINVSISQENGSGNPLSLSRAEGMNFDRGFISSYFVNNVEKMLVEYENVYVLVANKKITTLGDIRSILEQVIQKGAALLIIAEDVEGEALRTLVYNKVVGGLKVVAVKAPGFGDRRVAMLEDIAILTGAKLISDDFGMSMEHLTLADLGVAGRVVVSKDETTIVEAKGDKNEIDKRCKSIESQIDSAKSEYDREKLQERLGKLSGGISVISVSGMTEIESKERKYRVDDALNAVKAAVAEGVVAGGGCALLYASNIIGKDMVKLQDRDEKAGFEIVWGALCEPFTIIMRNAGIREWNAIRYQISQKKDPNIAFDIGSYSSSNANGANSHNVVNAFNAGIIDPVKVTKIALRSAASGTKSLASAEALLVEIPEERKNNSTPNMGDMGGYPGY